MGQLAKNDKLKNRFSKIEIEIDDESLGFKIDSQKVASIQTNAEIKKKSSLSKILVRILKLAITSTVEVLGFFCKEVVMKFVSRIYSYIQTMLAKLKEKEENMEVLLDEKISKIEAAKIQSKTISEKTLTEREIITNSYYADVNNLFKEMVEYNDFQMKGYLLKKTQANMEMNLEVLELISKKLNVSNMIHNVTKVKMKSVVENDELVMRATMELAKKGHMWTAMFGKYIVPDINKLIEKYEGKVVIKEVYNVTTKKDTFFITTSFKVVEEMKTEDIQKIAQDTTVRKERIARENTI